MLSIALKTEKRTADCEECPLCRVVLGKPQRAFAKHVGQHMEQIALMVLPRDTEDDSNRGSTVTNEDIKDSRDVNDFEEDTSSSDHQSGEGTNRYRGGTLRLPVPGTSQHIESQIRPLAQKRSRLGISPPCARSPGLPSQSISQDSPPSHCGPPPPPTAFDDFLKWHVMPNRHHYKFRTEEEGVQMAEEMWRDPRNEPFRATCEQTYEKKLQTYNEDLDKIKIGSEGEMHELNKITETLPEGQRESLPPSPHGKSDEGVTGFVNVSKQGSSLDMQSPRSHTEKDRDYSDLAESHGRRPGSSLFSLEDPAHHMTHTSDTFADWLFEPETVKGFMAAPDNAGGRSESRKTLGPPTDYLEDHPAPIHNKENRRIKGSNFRTPTPPTPETPTSPRLFSIKLQST